MSIENPAPRRWVGKSEEGRIYVRAELRAKEWGTELSLVGETRDGSGQIYMHLSPDDFEPAPGWSEESLRELWAIWKRWHLNGMRADCEHQRAGVATGPEDPAPDVPWNERPIDPDKPTNTYGTHYDGQRHASWNMLAWIRPDEHPNGLLSRPCPVCGYAYGSSWLNEELPAYVVSFIRAHFPGA